MKTNNRISGIVLLLVGILMVQANAQHVDLTLQDTTIATNAWFEATNSITTGSGFIIANGGDVTFRSGNYISLNPTFTVRLGGLFNAFPGAALGIEEGSSVFTNGLAVEQNYPNPFSHMTEIRYGLANHEHVTIVIYNLSGQKIVTLVSQNQQAGYHTVIWDGCDENGMKVNSGIYSYVVATSKSSFSKKMVVVE